MSSPVTAGQVAPGSEVYHEGHLCTVTSSTPYRGSVVLTWTEPFPGAPGHTVPNSGTYKADEEFGQIVAL